MRSTRKIRSVRRIGISIIGSISVLYPQYIEYPGSVSELVSTVNYQLGSTFLRKRVVGLEYHIDITISPLGYAGVENTDWKNLDPEITGQTANFRSGSRGGYFVVDCEITATGFAGVENVDWEWLKRNKHPTSVETTFRDGVRLGAYVIDQALTATGFSGSEGVDWKNIVENKLT